MKAFTFFETAFYQTIKYYLFFSKALVETQNKFLQSIICISIVCQVTKHPTAGNLSTFKTPIKTYGHCMNTQVTKDPTADNLTVVNLPLEHPLLFSVVFFNGISNQLSCRRLIKKGLHHKYLPLNFTKLLRAATRCIFTTLPNICPYQTSIFAKELHHRCLTRC